MKKLIILSISLLVLSSCSSDDESMDPIDNGISYMGNVKAIMDTNCISCHGDPLANGAPMPLLTLANVKEAIQNRDLIGRIEDGTMPPAGSADLSAAQIQTVKDWKANNYAN